MEPITVVIPIGPDPVYKEYLKECIDSLRNQTVVIDEILFIDDGAGLGIIYPRDEVVMDWGTRTILDIDFVGGDQDRNGKIVYYPVKSSPSNTLSFYKSPWNVGVADAFNFGVALSRNNLVFMLGSDDKLMPTCLEECVKEYEEKKIEGWYNVTSITESGDVSWIPNNAAMVTKKLWNELGGFPPCAGVGACDALVLSIMLKHMPERIIQVNQGNPLCWCREGDYQDTRKNAAFYALSGVIEIIRDKETERWSPKNG